MATVVSHAMRRIASTPDANYSSCGLRSEKPRLSWSQESESALSRSMRYADPWLYDSVRPPNGLLLAPALVLCSCSEYLNGTKRSSKKGPVTCKKCKGTRLPLSGNDSKFGTVRCFPTSSITQTPTRAGTVRVTSSTRPSILPSNADPYDLMRRSRLTVAENGSSQFRARSVSPVKSQGKDGRSSSTSRSKGKFSTVGRRSILECSVNPYDLMSSEDPPDSSITLLNGQRIRVTRPLCLEPEEYEDVQLRKPNKSQIPKLITGDNKGKSRRQQRGTNEKETDNNGNRFKSILKKPTTTFSDTDSERSPSPSRRSGSHFYLPLPSNPSTPRKKVQFLVENEPPSPGQSSPSEEEKFLYEPETESTVEEETWRQEESVAEEDKRMEELRPILCKLKRSESDRTVKEEQSTNKVVFHDSMALRSNHSRIDSRIVFTDKDLERLDGIYASRFGKKRPKQPPPEPPAIKEEIEAFVNEEKAEVPFNKQDEDTYCDVEVAPPVSVEAPSSVQPPPPPSVPPRKRSGNKQPKVVLETENYEPVMRASDKISIKTNYEDVQVDANKTVLQVNPSTPEVHKLKIKNEFPEAINVNTFAVSDTTLGKTSIMINGDDCYSTIKVCDEIPLYHSSVVVKDTGGVVVENKNKSSTVYITGNFVNTYNGSEVTFENCESTKEEVEQPSNLELLQCLSDPVEAVRRNLVPHVCGKSDPPRRPKRAENRKPLPDMQELSEEDKVAKFIEESFLKLRNNDIMEIYDKEVSSEHSSSTQYEIMDQGSECYTDHSNRSSITEEELNARTKFYELLAESSLVEVSENEDHHYESIKVNPDPIYEEIEVPPPLPANPPPASLLDDLQLDKEYTTRSIFEGASKYDILSYLVDAKERGIVPEDSYTYNFANADIPVEEEPKDANETPYNRVSHLSTVSDSSEDSSLVMQCSLTDDKIQRTVEVERNDSGVGSETSKSSLSKYRSKSDLANSLCEDCESNLDCQPENEPLICRKCVKKRTERKEIIMEIVETEEKYGRDLQIILEEFYQPMLVAGLLTSDQLSAIFLNVEELLENSQALSERLRDAVEIAFEQGDEDLQTVNIGKLVLEAAPMLHAFETYCVRQGAASLLLASLEKEKELLRIFLRVSQMENAVLRRMNLNSFLMVPVQRVTKYPLLLARLYKVTPAHHDTRDQLKEAQHKIELHLNHMNSETKDVPSKLWRRISSIPGRRSSAEMDLVNIKLRKIAVDVLEWNHDEARFALEGKLLFTQPTDNNWRKGRTIKLTPVNALLVTNGKSTSSTRTDPTEETLVFSRQAGVRDAALLLVRDKNGRYTLLREPLYLDRCVIAADPAWQSYFEVQELLGKDTFIFKAEDEDQTKIWYRQLQYYAQGMGAWRKRRNALANIMINGMGLRS